MKKIGIFAGTFDPIHTGHIAFARAALDEGLEKVMFLVEPRPRHKQGVKALEHRIAMVQLATKRQVGMGTIVLEQARFSVHETLPVLQTRFKGHTLVFLFGDDVVAHIAHWPDISTLLASAELLVASRGGNAEHIQAALTTLQKTRNMKLHYKIIPSPYDQLAASKIRLQLKRHQVSDGLTPNVQKYITKHGLYASVDSK